MAVDYEALAKQFGGSAAPAPNANINYEALAKQFGGGVAEQVSPRRQMVEAELRSAAAPFAGFSKGVGNVMFGGQRLVGKGLETVGNLFPADQTLSSLITGQRVLNPVEQAGRALIEDAARRQAEQEASIASYKAVAPTATGAGEFTGEVISTLPVGGVIAKGVSKIPGAGTVAEAIRTGGFRTGAPAATTFGGRAADVATRAGGGAVVGGTSAALINPEETGTGTVIGAVAPFVLPTAGKYIAQAGGKFIDAVTGKLANVEAGKIAREVAGDQINQIRAVNKLAPLDINAAQAAYGIDNDVYQAFLDFASGKDKSSYFRVLKDTQKTDQLNRLAQLAGGPTITENLTSVGQFKNALNNLMTPIRETELAAANIAGTTGRKLQSEADRLAAAATGKVQDVRRFTVAQSRAVTPAADNLASNQQLMKLAGRADEVATQAADESLLLGQAARFKQNQADSVAVYGLKPLTPDSVLSRVNNILNNPEFAGNDVIEGAIKIVANDINKWTKNGIVEAQALEAIRKNSVNAAIEKLRPGLDQTSKKNLAAGVIAQIKEPIINAIEEAGGTGYGQYLRDYAANAQLIDRRKLAGKALEMLNKSPDEFTRLVKGNNPDAVEAVFGSGSFNIFKEMGTDIKPMQQIADELLRDAKIGEQIKAGRRALGIEKESMAEKIPGFVGYKTAVAKKVLQTLEGKVSKKTIGILSDAAKTGKAMNEVLDTLPADERIKAFDLLTKSKDWSRAVTSGAIMLTTPSANALAPDQQNQNALAR
jgi:hypothetical protein